MDNTNLPAELINYYEQQVKPQLQQLEQLRLKDIKHIRLSWYFICTTALILLFMFFSNDDVFAQATGNAIVVITILIMAGSIGWQIFLKKRLRLGLKKSLIAPICAYFDMQYQAKGFNFTTHKFIELGILPNKADDTRLEDLIWGTHHDVQFKLCEALLTKDVKDNDDNSHTETLFKGLLLQYEFPKPFIGEIRVLSKKHRSSLFKASFKGERIVLEDPKFNDMFAVYATDQIESRYILTPNFMERILALAKHFSAESGRLALAFYADQLLISVHTNKDRFEGGDFKNSFLDTGRLNDLVGELSIIQEIITTLNLNNHSRS